MIRREKKSRKKRGYEMHSGLRRRGAGNRGGRGNAGQGKKSGSQKQTKRLAEGRKLGRYGFTSHSQKKAKAINLGELMKYAKNGVADAVKLGYNKVLGKGKVLEGITVKATAITQLAKEKIKKAKGKIVM